jgi:hypothetical protein
MSVKYRQLTSEELAELEKEFVDFLVVNGITADSWESMKQEENEKAQRMIELFSDVVFEGVMRKARYIDHVASDSLYCFHFLDQEVQLVGLEDTTGTIDFTQEDALNKLQHSIPTGVKVFFQKKSYQEQREVEVFDLIKAGAEVSEGQLFKQLSLLYASSQVS